MELEVFKENLNKFFELEFLDDIKIVYPKNRQELNKYYGNDTPSRLIWFTNKKDTVYILDKENFEKESNKKYNSLDYEITIKHEIVHLYYRRKTKAWRPIWLNEWLAIYLSGKLKHRHPHIDKFQNFLNFYYNTGKEVYHESWFVIQILIEQFGVKKFQELLKNINSLEFKQIYFEKIFEEIYWFEIIYKNINKFLKS